MGKIHCTTGSRADTRFQGVLSMVWPTDHTTINPLLLPPPPAADNPLPCSSSTVNSLPTQHAQSSLYYFGIVVFLSTPLTAPTPRVCVVLANLSVLSSILISPSSAWVVPFWLNKNW
ncbi:Hypothetical predicted protein [Podarcis lilfordi]|uniref:Uncharacterized protein n=1 Tax=Podarcis lilfordi TaxID=74358 RepID=A0AA35KA38_9SAUR|nr:Hypothetical predicted protein [Podarcis lilfordi]